MAQTQNRSCSSLYKKERKKKEKKKKEERITNKKKTVYLTLFGQDVNELTTALRKPISHW